MRKALFGHECELIAYSQNRSKWPLVTAGREGPVSSGEPGTLKVESQGWSRGLFMGLKSYRLDRGEGGSAASEFENKIKACTMKESVTGDMVAGVIGGKAGLTETRMELQPSGGGINVVQGERKISSYKTTANYKFRLDPQSGDCRAFV